MRIKIVFNNCSDWTTIPDKVRELKKWAIKWNPYIEVEHTSFNEIPFDQYPGYPSDVLGIDHDWYDKNVAEYGVGFDVLLFVVNNKQWKVPNRARGWRTDSDFGAVELHIGCDENEQNWGYPQYSRRMSMFFLNASHEIAHAAYMLSGQEDKVHYFFDMGKLDLVFDDVLLPENYSIPGIVRALNYIHKKLQKIFMNKKTMNDVLYERSLAYVGVDVTPQDKIPDEVACAECVSTILKSIKVEVPIITGTWTLDDFFKKRTDLFRKVETPRKGTIIMSPTGTGNGTRTGHTGIVGDHGIVYSNNSRNGMWDTHWSIEAWKQYYVVEGGLELNYYELI